MAKPVSIRIILSLAASEHLTLKQIDDDCVPLVPLWRISRRNILYMRQPDEFDDGTGRVFRLNKSLYFLKQASRCWNKKFTSFLCSFGLVASQVDSCVLISRRDNQVIVLAIYIDDGLLAFSNQSYATQFIEHMCQEFQITDCTGSGLLFWPGDRIRK